VLDSVLNSMKQKIIISILLALLMSGCRSIYYEATTPNIPVFDEGEIINGGAELSNHGFNSNMNFRILKYGVFQANASYCDWNFFLGGANSFYSFGFGGVYQSDKMHVSLVTGYGKGWSHFSEGIMDHEFKGNGVFDQVYFQPALAFGNKYFKVGLAAKTALMQYKIISTTWGGPDNPGGLLLNHNYKCLSIEPVLFCRVNMNSFFYATFYLGRNFFFSEIPFYHDMSKTEVYIGFGVGLKISKQMFHSNKSE